MRIDLIPYKNISDHNIILAQRMTLSEYRNFFTLDLDEFLFQHNIPKSQVKKNLRYEKLIDVSLVDLPDNQFFFFQNEKLKMIYISGEVSSKKVWNEFQATTTDKPDETVRSRAGKTSNHLVFARHGFSASISKDEVDFVEIYPSCSLHEYLDNIYRDVGPFIRYGKLRQFQAT